VEQVARMTGRSLRDEADKHFRGTPASRLRLARRLGRRAIELYRAALPEGTTFEQARRELEARKNRGRRPSACIDALGE
jgi:hypothetical protein